MKIFKMEALIIDGKQSRGLQALIGKWGRKMAFLMAASKECC